MKKFISIIILTAFVCLSCSHNTVPLTVSVIGEDHSNCSSQKYTSKSHRPYYLSYSFIADSVIVFTDDQSIVPLDEWRSTHPKDKVK